MGFPKTIGVMAAPAQIDCEARLTLNVGLGFTVTIIVKLLPIQLPEFVLIVYVAVCGVFVGLVSVWAIDDALVPVVAPVNPPVTIGKPHEYVVPGGTLFPPPSTGIIVKTSPLQTKGLMLAISATGLTVTVTVNGFPTQKPVVPDVGVTVYVAVCVVFVGLVNVPKIDACAVPAAPPVIPPVTVGALQVYVVPEGTTVDASGTPFIGEVEAACPCGGKSLTIISSTPGIHIV